MKTRINCSGAVKDKEYYIAFLSCCLLLPLFLGSCNKLVTADAPSNQIISSNVFQDEATATSAVVGIYAFMTSGTLQMYNGGVSVYNSLSSDELQETGTDPDIDPIYSNSIPTNNFINSTFWSRSYKLIYQANAALEGLSASKISDATKRQLMGEAKFLRAFYYSYLTSLYGDVPLILSTDYQKNQAIGRTSKDSVISQIIEDLKDAKSLLNTSYPSAGPVRANKWVASALLARMYLYKNDWVNAEAESSAVIGSGMYNLTSSLTSVFLAKSTEAIWQIMPTISGFNSPDGYTFIPNGNVVPLYTTSPYLLNSFDNKDSRRSTWIKSVTVNGKVYNYPFKYTVKTSTTVTEYMMVLRLAEQYLVRAEAEAQLSRISGAVADINMLRKRAGADTIAASINQTDCITAVYKERQLELFTEWGHRWFDLQRTGRADAVLGAEKPGWKSTAILFPVPDNEILTNPFLTQNNGY